jgi:hypothetical protein
MSSTPGKPYGKGRFSTVDLHVLNNFDQLILFRTYYLPFLQNKKLKEEVNCT